jgi:hypothetical protein
MKVAHCILTYDSRGPCENNRVPFSFGPHSLAAFLDPPRTVGAPGGTRQGVGAAANYFRSARA